MARIYVYLQFNGNCTEAMNFYKDSIGGELEIQTMGESPMGEGASDEVKKQVLHSSLLRDDLVLYASDNLAMGEENTVNQGNTFAICFTSPDLEELKAVFAKMSEGGNVLHELKTEFFGTYGDLTDKYGYKWMFQSDNKTE